MKPVIVIGAGGHARVVLDTLRAQGRTVAGLTDPQRTGKVDGVAIIGDDDALPAPHEVDLANGLGSTEDTALRRTVFEGLKAKGYDFATLVHPSAVIAAHVTLGEGCQVMAGAVVQVGGAIGANAIVNTRASIDHDAIVGAHAHIAPGAVLSGNVTVGDGGHVGTGAAVIQGIDVGAGALVAAGATVCANVTDNARVAGTPAKEIGS